MEAVIFDLDGLLADTEIISLKVYQELLRDFGIPFTEETYSRDYSGHREEENVQRFLDTYDYPGTLTKPWIKFMNWKLKS